MGNGRTITARDIARAGKESLPTLIPQLVKQVASGSVEAKEAAIESIRSLAAQNHGEHARTLFEAKAVGPVVKLLSEGSAKAQAASAAALHSIMSDQAAHQQAVMEAGGAAVLVRLVKTGSPKVQEAAASALSAIQDDVSHQKLIIQAGCIANLIALLQSGSDAAKAYSCQALANAAAFDEDAQNAIAKLGGVPLVVKLLSLGAAQTPAARAIMKLADNNQAVQAALTEAGSIPPLLSLLTGPNPEAQAQAASAISAMVRGDIGNQAAVAQAGGMGPLIALLSSNRRGNGPVMSQAMSALAEMAGGNRENQDAIARQGGIKPLVRLIEPSEAGRDVQAHAALAIMAITRHNIDNQTAVVDLGGISHLSALMKQSAHSEVKAEVAGALWSLSEAPELKVAISRSGTIAPLVELLGSGGPRARNHAANALASLGHQDAENQVKITQMLIDLLSTGAGEAQTRAVHALRALIDENPSANQVIAEAGNPALLVQLLQSDVPVTRDYALWSLSLSISRDKQAVVAEAGGVQPLINSLADGRTLIQMEAAAALAKLALNNDENAAAITKDGGVRPLIRLLSSQGEEGIGSEEVEASLRALRQNVADALANLAVDPVARDEIVAAGGIRPLVRVLEVDGNEAKTFASSALARLAKDHEATQSAIAAAGAINALVELLDGKEGSDAQEAAAGALYALAGHELNRMAITESDGIGLLVMMLGCNNPRAREHAEGALVRLSIENANRVLIIKKLVDMLHDQGSNLEQAGGEAAAALANLARESEDNRKSIVDSNGIPPLLALLESTSSKAKENSISAIKELCRGSRENQAAVAKVGGIPKLVGVITHFSGTTIREAASVQLCILAASAIEEMAKDNRKNQVAIAESGAIPPLVLMLSSPTPQMQANASGALANLARDHPENQAAIAKMGGIAPLCSLVRDGEPETQEQSAAAVWSLATDNAPNKDTIAKLGGIDPLVGLLITGNSEQSQVCAASALAALASKHMDNREYIAKRLVGLLSSSAAREPSRGSRALMTCSSFLSDSSANQVAFVKVGGLPPLITWLNSASTSMRAAHTLLCLVTNNTTTQIQAAKSGCIPPLVKLVGRSSPKAQEHAARALWHLASQAENQTTITENDGIKPLVAMLGAEGDVAPELAAVIMVRLARDSPDVCISIAEKGGIVPLVRLAKLGAPKGQQQAAAVLSELALVSKNRDIISSAGAIMPVTQLLTAPVVGTPEIAATVLANLAHEDDPVAKKQPDSDKPSDKLGGRRRRSDEPEVIEVLGAAVRRAQIHQAGGLQRLIWMLDGTNLTGGDLEARKVMDQGDQKESEKDRVANANKAAAALADIALDDKDMQDAIIDVGGIPPLLSVIRLGSQLGQEHAARALQSLGSDIANQASLISSGTIPELVQLLKTGSLRAQELAAAGLSDLGRGAIVQREALRGARMRQRKAQLQGSVDRGSDEAKDDNALAASSTSASEPYSTASSASALIEDPADLDDVDEEEGSGPNDSLVAIVEAGGIVPLVALLASSNMQARENAACALWHLALEPSNRVAIAKANGIAPLVTTLDDGTPKAHEHAANALARLALGNADNQAQIAKHCVALLGNQSAGPQQRAARALRDLAAENRESPVVIVNAGAISPLVTLLWSGTAEVKVETAGALSTLSLNSPSTQLAIATGLIALLGSGTAEAQEHVTALLVILAQDAENVIAIAKSGAIPRLVVQVHRKISTKAQELAAAVLSHLSAASTSTEDNIKAITTVNGTRPLIATLSHGSSIAQAHAAAVVADIARASSRNQKLILSEGGVSPLVAMLSNHNSKARAQAAGALLALASGQPETQHAIAAAGAIRPLVGLLSEENDLARQKAAGAIAALANKSKKIQDAIDAQTGIDKLVSLLMPTLTEPVRAEAAAAIAVLARSNQKIQDKVATLGGIKPLVEIMQADGAQHAKEEAAAALWSLSEHHYANQMTVAETGGIAPLVEEIGRGSVRAQEHAAGALAALSHNNQTNELSIAELIVALLGSDDKQASAKAALAISRLARSHASNQQSLAKAGGVELLVQLLETDDIPFKGAPGPKDSPNSPEKIEFRAKVQKVVSVASAIWSMAYNNAANQMAIAQAGGIPPLIALLKGPTEIHRDAAGALWSLAADPNNQELIADQGGIIPLVSLLRDGSSGSQETAAGALHALAETDANRVSIANAGGIPLLVALFGGESEAAIEQASGALETLVRENQANQLTISNGLVAILQKGSSRAQEHVADLLRKLARDPDNRAAIAKAGAVPELVRQLEHGSEKAMGMAASALGHIALQSEAHRATVTRELVKLLASDIGAVRQRASEALRDMAAEDKASGSKKNRSTGGGAPLVNLLKDGLKDDNTEAQEYALWSLSSSIYDPASQDALIAAGGIKPVIDSLLGGKLSLNAQSHGAAVLSGLAPVATNAQAIKEARGIDPLVHLLSQGNVEAKEHAAAALAQIAMRADASHEIAKAGAVSAFVQWLVDPTLGPPSVAAQALSDIALDNPDIQTQIAEEGAIPPLVDMVGAASLLQAAHDSSSPGRNDPSSPLPTVRTARNSNPSPGGMTSSAHAKLAAIRLSTLAAGALATLAKENVVNQIIVNEEGGIPHLVELLKGAESTHKHAHESATRALGYLGVEEYNRSAIARAGGIGPLVTLLNSESETTQKFTAATLELLACHPSNQIALAKAGAIAPLVNLLSSTESTSQHAIGALLYLASHDEMSRNAVVQRLVAVLGQRNASAQMKSAEALAVLAMRSPENRKAITAANAIEPLVALLGDGRRVRSETPQERAAAVLAGLARAGENKVSIITAGGGRPLVSMLSSDSIEAQTHAAAALWHISAVGSNRDAISTLGCIGPLVNLLSGTSGDAQKFSAGTLWHLASSADNRVAMVNAGAIHPLVDLLSSSLLETREHAAAVLSALARSQGDNKKAVYQAGGIPPMVCLLSEASTAAQKHAASALWGLADGKDGIYDKFIVEHGGVEPLINIMQRNDPETRGFAAACLLCICKDSEAVKSIIKFGGAEPLQALAHGPATWLRTQAVEMLKLLSIPIPDPDEVDISLVLGIPAVSARSPRGGWDDEAASVNWGGDAQGEEDEEEGEQDAFGGSAIDRIEDDPVSLARSVAANSFQDLMRSTGPREVIEEIPMTAAKSSRKGQKSSRGAAKGSRPASSSKITRTPRGKKSARGGGFVGIGDVAVARCKLKIRTQSDLTSTSVGDLPAGSRVRIFDVRELDDGTSRVAIAYDNKPPMGWVSCVSTKDMRETFIPQNAPEAVALMRGLAGLKSGDSGDAPREVSIAQRTRYHFWSFQKAHATGER